MNGGAKLQEAYEWELGQVEARRREIHTAAFPVSPLADQGKCDGAAAALPQVDRLPRRQVGGGLSDHDQ